MKHIATLSLILVMSASDLAIGQTKNMKDMPTKNMEMQKCMDMEGMGRMNMKDRNMQKCNDMMSGKGKKQTVMGAKPMTYPAIGVVKEVDLGKGTVRLAHEPVKSLNWPAMTMSFSVKDKALFDQLAVGKKVNIEFTKDGSDYVVSSVK